MPHKSDEDVRGIFEIILFSVWGTGGIVTRKESTADGSDHTELTNFKFRFFLYFSIYVRQGCSTAGEKVW